MTHRAQAEVRLPHDPPVKQAGICPFFLHQNALTGLDFLKPFVLFGEYSVEIRSVSYWPCPPRPPPAPSPGSPVFLIPVLPIPQCSPSPYPPVPLSPIPLSSQEQGLQLGAWSRKAGKAQTFVHKGNDLLAHGLIWYHPVSCGTSVWTAAPSPGCLPPPAPPFVTSVPSPGTPRWPLCGPELSTSQVKPTFQMETVHSAP